MRYFTMTVLCVLLGAPVFAAELELYGAIGQADNSLTSKPGLWRNEGQPYDYDGTSMGFRAGLAAGFALGELGTPAGIPLTHGLRIELGAVSLGSPEMVKSVVNSDDSYDKHGECYKRCDQLHEFNVVDDYLGAEMVAKYGVTAWDFLEVYITGGVAGFSHRLSGSHIYPSKQVTTFDSHSGAYADSYAGMVLAGVIGGGVCGKTGPVYLCGDVEKFLPFAHTANPLIGTGVNGPVLTTFQARVPFWSW